MATILELRKRRKTLMDQMRPLAEKLLTEQRREESVGKE